MKKYMLLVKILFLISSVTAKEQSGKFTHPNNLYNSGVDFYYNNDYGQAMKCLKKAMLLDPGNKEIRALFYQLRREIGVPVVFTQDNMVNRIFSIFFNLIPPQWNAILSSTLLLIVSFILFFFVKKKEYFFHIIVMYVSAVIILPVGLIRYYVFFSAPDRIAIFPVDLYDDPDEESKNNMTLPAGSELRIIDQVGEFLLIRTIDKKEAWVKQESVPPLWQG